LFGSTKSLCAAVQWKAVLFSCGVAAFDALKKGSFQTATSLLKK